MRGTGRWRWISHVDKVPELARYRRDDTKRDDTKDSAVGASATASTSNLRSSRTNFAVVGPMAASRARRNSDSLSDDGEDLPAVIEKCWHNAGMTCPAAEGAKKTIHHGSSSASCEMI